MREITRVPLEWRLLPTLLRAEPDESWLPLVLAMRHVERTAAPPSRNGPAILGPVIAQLQT